MSLLWRLIFTSRCTSTHHKMALDALRFLRGPMSDVWSNLFLANHEQYLTGAKAPDDVFKDFKNHVLHVEQGFWGGATLTARTWYQKTVTSLSQGNWPEAIFNAGVLSHYFTDPFQPFHTGQTESEGKVHRAAEWSITKSYDELQAILEHDLGGYPEFELTERPDWLEEAIRVGATEAHASYDVCIDHYDLSRGIKNPPSGLDQEMKDRLALLIGKASVGFSRVLERAFDEAAVTPPDVAVSLHAFIATMKMPLNWVMRKITDAHERAVVEAIYLEVQEKGKALDSLPEDEKTVRKLHAQEVLRVPLRELDAEPTKITGSQYGTGKPARGMTAKVSYGATFERTHVSKPLRLTTETDVGGKAPLETCLMVPLAANSPIDHVADTALRALLSQAIHQQSTKLDSSASQVTSQVLRTATSNALGGGLGGSPTSAAASGSSAKVVAAPANLTNNPAVRQRDASAPASPVGSVRPSAPSTSAPLKSPSGMTQNQPVSPITSNENGSTEPRVRSSKRRSAANFPEITPPTLTLPLAPLDYVPATSGFEAAMFAPLPPAPTPVIREPNDGLTPARTRTEVTSDSEQQPIGSPQSNRSSIEARATSAAPQNPATTPATVSARSESGPADSRRASNQNPPERIASGTPAAAPSRTQPPRSTERFVGESRPDSRSEGGKSFVAEPPQSPIPTPHMRLEESASDRSTAEFFDENSEDEPYEQQESQPRVSMSRGGTKPVNRISQIIPAKSSAGATGVSHSRPMTTSNSNAVQANQTPHLENSRPATSSSTGTLRPQTSPMVSGPGALQSSLFTTVKSAPQTRVNPMASMNTSPVSDSFAMQSQSGRSATSESPARPTAKGFEGRGPESRGHSVDTVQQVATWSPPPPRDFPRPPSVSQDMTSVSPFASKTTVNPLASAKSTPATATSAVDAAHTAETKVQPQQSIATETETETNATLPESTREAKAQPRAAREPRYYLNPSSNVVDAPSIGPKAAQLFEAIGVRTVFDLLKINTDQAAEQIANPRITAAVLKDLQAQALLVCRVPELRGHDAQYLVACQVRTAEQLGNCHAETLLIQVQEFLKTTVGQRLQRGGKTPDLAEVQEWINSARGARSLRNE